MIVKGVLVGFLAGAIYAMTGYFKAYQKHNEDFNAKKFLKTLALGGILGAINFYLGLGMVGDEIAALALAGEVAVIEQLLKAIFGRASVE